MSIRYDFCILICFEFHFVKFFLLFNEKLDDEIDCESDGIFKKELT